MTGITNGNVRRIILLGAAILLATTLAGCTPFSNGLSKEKPAAVEKTATPTTSFEAGAVVKADVKLPDTQKAYPMADGTFVVVDNTKPLPAPVVADVIAAAAPAAALQVVPIDLASTVAASDFNRANREAAKLGMETYLYAKKAELGKDIVLVYPVTTLVDYTSSKIVWLANSSRGRTGIMVGTQTATTAAAQEWAVSAGAEVIVLP
jgi:hypothetical protein